MSGGASTGADAKPSASESASTESAPDLAWNPFTPRGVAAFARSSLTRICWLQVIFAAVSSLTVAWFVGSSLFPAVSPLLQQLPDDARLRFGELQMGTNVVMARSETGWMSLSIDSDSMGGVNPGGGFDVCILHSGVRFCSPLGCAFFRYSPFWDLPFNRTELVPWWEAWHSLWLVVVAFGAFVWLIVIWWITAALFCPLPRLVAFYTERALTMVGAWKLSATALLPGAMILMLSFVGLGFGVLGPLHFVLGALLHFAAPLVYLVLSPLYLPKLRKLVSASGNPFGAPLEPAESLTANPFGSVAVKTTESARKASNPFTAP